MEFPPHQQPLFQRKMKTKPRPIMATAAQVMSALRLRYPVESHALLEQVANGTGARHQRVADAVVIGLWPSRGLEIIGIEVKVRRADWYQELHNPAKADPIAKYCDRWLLVVGDENIVHEGELPVNWGLLVPRDEKTLRCAKDAPLIKDHLSPDKTFVAAMMRAAQGQLTPAANMQREYERGRKEGIEAGRKQGGFDLGEWKRKFLDLQGRVQEFEKTSGVRIIDAWQIGNVADAVRSIMTGEYMRTRQQMRTVRNQISAILDSVDKFLVAPEPGTTQPVNGKEQHAPDHNH